LHYFLFYVSTWKDYRFTCITSWLSQPCFYFVSAPLTDALPSAFSKRDGLSAERYHHITEQEADL